MYTYISIYTYRGTINNSQQKEPRGPRQKREAKKAETVQAAEATTEPEAEVAKEEVAEAAPLILGVSKKGGSLFRSPCNEDPGLLGSIGTPVCGNPFLLLLQL